ncbi:MAG: J domain-containing protein [Bacteroidota bacterium]
MLQDPYTILGITPTATLDEIKKAYRAKAFLLHPDKNKASDAQHQFVALTEAYEEVLAKKTNTFKKYTSPFQDIEQRQQREREAARRRAQEYARMRYEEFEKTEAAQTINAINVIFDHLIFLFVCALLLAVPLVLGYLYDFTGIILGLLFLLAIGRPVIGYIKHYFQPAQLWVALMSLVETYFFRFVILSATNLYILLKVGLQTMLPLPVSLAILVIPALVYYFVWGKKVEARQRVFFTVCLVPLIFNALFALNFWASRNPSIEQYEIWDEHTHSKTTTHPNTLIMLENDAYANYVGIRIFSDIRIMQNNEHIIYQFEKGLLGIRVMKEYRFIE